MATNNPQLYFIHNKQHVKENKKHEYAQKPKIKPYVYVNRKLGEIIDLEAEKRIRKMRYQLMNAQQQ